MYSYVSMFPQQTGASNLEVNSKACKLDTIKDKNSNP